MAYKIVHADCLDWLRESESSSFHAVITDPPFGMREYEPQELEKLRRGKGGVWRIPPAIGGVKRAPVPRFTVLTSEDAKRIYQFFRSWAELTGRVLIPGAHVFVASSPLLSHVVCAAISEAGLEKRGEIIRLVRTLRGGDRPKGAETEFAEISAMPRACYEPWLVFRKRFSGTLAANLRRWGTGGLRRPSREKPFPDVIPSGRTPRRERLIASHPSLKPQKFLRQLVWAALPTAKGKVLDPFAGAGSTLAAAEALGHDSVGIEIDEKYVETAQRAIPRLARLEVDLGFGGEKRLPLFEAVHAG
ncbi:MAG: DNA-methyltransferase [Candidatus Acidiferrales bacterium]